MILFFVSHPIQHYVPWFQLIAKQLGDEFMVCYASRHGVEASHDREFGQHIAWEMDLLEGYNHRFLVPDDCSNDPSGGFNAIRYDRLRDTFNELKPDAIMVFGWLYRGYWQVAQMAYKLGVPYIMRGESNLLNQANSIKWWLKDMTVGRLIRRATACLAIGERNTALYKKHGVDKKRISKALYFVDNQYFREQALARANDANRWRDEHGFSQSDVLFLFMGKLIEKKHPDHLIKAWHALPEQSKAKSGLVIVGSGAQESYLKKLASSDSRIVFTGFLNRNDLPLAYSITNALVLPSDEGETWGLVVNEAMASGKPVIASNRVGSVPDLIIEGDTGFSYPFSEIKELTDKMQTLINQPELIEGMGNLANEHIAIATAASAADAVVELYQQIKTAEIACG